MNYLDSHILASVPALLVISRYLAEHPEGVKESSIRTALRPTIVSHEQSGTGMNNDITASSLRVGEDIGLFRCEKAGERVWTIEEAAITCLPTPASTDTRVFRGGVLRLLAARALQNVRAQEPPSDLAIGLTWLALQDPRTPISNSWNDGRPEANFTELGMRKVIANVEQWRAFRRWAAALGLATAIQRKNARLLLVDATAPLFHILPQLPQRHPASLWFQAVYEEVPVLGHPALVAALPTRNGSEGGIPPALAFAALKLQRQGHIELEPSADARSAAVLRIGEQTSRIGEVRIVRTAK